MSFTMLTDLTIMCAGHACNGRSRFRNREAEWGCRWTSEYAPSLQHGALSKRLHRLCVVATPV